MSRSAVVIVSKDPDFAQTLAEQITSELAVSCSTQPVFDAEMPASLIISDAPVESSPSPVLVVGNTPVRMQALLADIAQALQVDTLPLPHGYLLHVRQKQLAHGGKTVDLTDKEVQLLKSLANGKGGREELLRSVWGIESALDTHTLETHIYRLRNKCRELAGDDMILATDGGYRLKEGR